MAEYYPFSKPNDEERTLSILSHILTIVPGIGILAPLVIYLTKKPGAEFLEANARESLNFQISVWIAYFVAGILCIVLIGLPLLGLIYVLSIVFAIVASVKASDNKVYQYPFSLRLIK